MHQTVDTTSKFQELDGICVLGWGFYIRVEDGFISVCADGMALLCLDKAIEEKLSGFGTSNLAEYF
jgi:hypothetical protein